MSDVLRGRLYTHTGSGNDQYVEGPVRPWDCVPGGMFNYTAGTGVMRGSQWVVDQNHTHVFM